MLFSTVGMLRRLLEFGPLRRRVALAMKTHYFGDLGLALPLAHELTCPFTKEEHRISFWEIFIDGEYGQLLQHLPPPSRWIDLGCHAGYFSLWLEWRRRCAGLPSTASEALLVDADIRCRKGVELLIGSNRLDKRWIFREGVIAAGTGERRFAVRSFMSSAIAREGEGPRNSIMAPICTQEALAAALPPPYDLIKLDVEGGEYDFAHAYAPLYCQARAIVVEWHGSTVDDSRVDALRSTFRAQGFPRSVPLRAPRIASPASPTAASGLELFLPVSPQR